MAVPGIGLPAAALALGTKRIHDISIDRRTVLSKNAYVDGDKKAAIALHLLNTAFSPLDITSVGINTTLRGLASVWRGNGPVAKVANNIIQWDPKIDGIKEVDGGLVNKIFNVAEKVVKWPTFGATAVPQTSAA